MNKNILITVVVICAVAAGYFFWHNQNTQTTTMDNYSTSTNAYPYESDPNFSTSTPSAHTITLKTNFGDIQFMTYDNEAPKTVANFITLVNKKFYDGITFHRVIKGFMIQGGDPYCAAVADKNLGVCGTGGPGYRFEDELNPETLSYKEGYKKGVVAMANAGPNTNGSQFFIMLQDYPLPNNYTIFGKVIAGQEIVDAIGSVKTDAGDRPLSPVIIESATVDGYYPAPQ